ncbi:MAG TPA: glycosyltransferase [Candidatus Limnocylindrales bacterium]|nr:glycosyltransferase [Candidatus Limnocylindrales bacterium]
MRVVMYVQNDATHDSRVLREAASLAGAGHTVTVMATTRSPDEPDGSREERDGFAIVRVSIPPADRARMELIRAPWRARGKVARVVLAPWMIVRGAWVAIVNRGLRRPIRMGWLEYVRRWQQETLGWCRLAVRYAPVADVHHAHDMEALPAARAAARRDGSQYVYDSHEIFTEWGAHRAQAAWLRRLSAAWERRLARGAAAVVTVNDAIAGVLRRRLAPRRIVVVHNCPPPWHPPGDAPDHLRLALAIPPGAPIVLCHGNLMAGRGLEETAAALREPGLEAAHLVFLGYRVSVVDRLVADPSTAGRVHFLPAVRPQDVVEWVAGADADVMAIQPTDLNSRLSSPNKLFESIAAGVPVVSSDLPVRRRILVDDPDGPLGELCDPTDPASIAAAIRRVLDASPPERADRRARILRAAHERWNWETEGAKLVALYDELAASGRSATG